MVVYLPGSAISDGSATVLIPGSVSARYDAFMSNKRFGALDALRTISVLAVIWHHVSGRPGGGISDRGNLGVEFFFAISGFLITTLLLREYSSTGGIGLRNFYVRRTLRIFPVYYLVLAVYVALVVTTRADTPSGEAFFRNLPAFATYTSNWFVSLDGGENVIFYFAWSLATEEQYYIIWAPVLALILTWRKKPWLGVVVLIAASVASIIAESQNQDVFVTRVVSSLAEPILWGSVAAIVVSFRVGYTVVFWFLGGRAASLVLLAGTLTLLHFGVDSHVAGLLFVLIVTSLCLREDTWLHPILQLQPLVFVGAISYGIYLMHMLAANVVRLVVGHQYGMDVFIGTAELVIPLAWLSYRFFEVPMMRLRTRFER